MAEAAARNLILSGGPIHPFPENSKLVAELLSAVGIESSVTEDLDEGLAAVAAGEYELVTFNLLRSRTTHERFPEFESGWPTSLPLAGRASVWGHLGAGSGILALHTAAVSFDDWPGWGRIVGGVWDWERSIHPPVRPSPVKVAGDHPIVAGLGDFEIEDEIYRWLSYQPDIEPLLASPAKGTDHPLLWARSVDGGRVVFDALGHDERSLTHPTHQTIVRRAALWALGTPDAEVAAAA